MGMADVVVCSTCYGDVPRPPHPGPNYCCRACEPWVLQHAHEERDQLRTENAHLLEQSGQACGQAGQAEDRAEKAERERDEARALAEKWRDSWGASTGHYLPADLHKAYPFPWENAGDRQGGASDAPGSTPDAGHHIDPQDWNPGFTTKETKR